ncbi:hypothetical protein [Geobacter sp.]|uniref:hypothetical protein n=1 Tax=Geobacter sp. TaxID=46610 RepID=UPI0027B8DF0B|nr:hypothetical protein [Geobacter sp.]
MGLEGYLRKADTACITGAMLLVMALAPNCSHATAPGNHGGAVAGNNFSPNDLGKSAREEDKNPKNGKPDYEDKNPNAGERNYQTHGSPDLNHDGVGGHDKDNNGVRGQGEDPFDRGDLGSMAARYQGPKNGYEQVDAPAPCTGKITVPKAGGANYGGDFPKTAANEIDHKKVVENTKKFVHDLLQPACWPPGQGTVTDKDVVDDFNAGNLDIGKRHHPLGKPNFVCHNQTSMFCSLIRELGYPCREKWVSLTRDGKHVYPEAATNVWYNGEWHLEDPFLLVNDKKENYKSTSVTDVRIWQSRTGPWDRGPGSDPDTPSTPPDETALRSGTLLEQQNQAVLTYVTDQNNAVTGDLTNHQDNVPIDSLLAQFGGTVAQIPNSWYSPAAQPILTIWDDTGTVTGVTPEQLFIGFPSFNLTADQAGTKQYQVCVHTDSGTAQDYNVAVKPIETNRAVTVQPTTLSGIVFPGQTSCSLLSVTVGDVLCDIDRDGDVDIKDINAIFAARNTEGTGDRRDTDGDGTITTNDARICSQHCSNLLCASFDFNVCTPTRISTGFGTAATACTVAPAAGATCTVSNLAGAGGVLVHCQAAGTVTVTITYLDSDAMEKTVTHTVTCK